MNIVRRDITPPSTYRRGSIDEQLGRMVETMFEDMLAPLGQLPLVGRGQLEGALVPRLEVAETDQAYQVQAELPGIDKENVRIAIDGRRVSIDAEEQEEKQTANGGNTVYTERSIRKYARSFTLPVEVDDAAVEARLENGVLKMMLPKKQATQSKRVTVQ